MNIDSLIKSASHRLCDVSDTPRLDAEVLLADVLKKDRAYLFTWPDKDVSDEQLEKFNGFLQRRLQGEPIAYIVGYREFWSLKLEVNKDTLIPRADTELLVELALKAIPIDESCIVADLGTGSGAIALAIASERPRCKVVATDASVKALAVAMRNAQRLGISNVEFYQGRWCEALPKGSYTVIVSNPPYIDADDAHLLHGDVKFEPLDALISASKGLADCKHIIAEAKPYLQKQGWLMLEHGFNQAQAVREIMQSKSYNVVETYTDLGGRERVTVGRKK